MFAYTAHVTNVRIIIINMLEVYENKKGPGQPAVAGPPVKNQYSGAVWAQATTDC